MKKIIFFIAVAVSLSSFSVMDSTQGFDFVGKWSGKDKDGKTGSFVFEPDGTVTTTIDGETIIGKDVEMNSKHYAATYSFNQEANPIVLTIELRNIEKDIAGNMVFLVKVVDKNHIMFNGNRKNGSAKPTTVTKNNSMTLTRE